jgi:nicotinate-nucleotide adenylyltransferase
MVPMAVYVRPGSGRRAPVSMAANALSRWRVDEDDAPRLATLPAPAWIYLHGQQSPLSSSAIRARRQHVKPK